MHVDAVDMCFETCTVRAENPTILRPDFALEEVITLAKQPNTIQT